MIAKISFHCILNIKIYEVENKMIPDVSELVKKKADYDAQITYIKESISLLLIINLHK